MGGTCGTYGGDERCIQGQWENLRERYHLEDIGGNWRVILKEIFKKWDGGVDWINVTQYRDKGWALVETVTDIRVAQSGGNFLSS
jgi:hypothetical protein